MSLMHCPVSTQVLAHALPWGWISCSHAPGCPSDPAAELASGSELEELLGNSRYAAPPTPTSSQPRSEELPRAPPVPQAPALSVTRRAVIMALQAAQVQPDRSAVSPGGQRCGALQPARRSASAPAALLLALAGAEPLTGSPSGHEPGWAAVSADMSRSPTSQQQGAGHRAGPGSVDMQAEGSGPLLRHADSPARSQPCLRRSWLELGWTECAPNGASGARLPRRSPVPLRSPRACQPCHPQRPASVLQGVASQNNDPPHAMCA